MLNVKYQRDDKFLADYMLDDTDRARLNERAVARRRATPGERQRGDAAAHQKPPARVHSHSSSANTLVTLRRWNGSFSSQPAAASRPT